MSTNISIDEAQARLREIIAKLGPDEEVVITEGQQSVAKLVGGGAAKRRREPGRCKGMITLLVEDDEHLEGFKEYMP